MSALEMTFICSRAQTEMPETDSLSSSVFGPCPPWYLEFPFNHVYKPSVCQHVFESMCYSGIEPHLLHGFVIEVEPAENLKWWWVVLVGPFRSDP